MTTKISEVLKQAKALIDKPEKWVKGSAHYRYAYGMMAHCSIGAVTHLNFTARDTVQLACTMLDRAVPSNFKSNNAMAVQYNDSKATTHADIMAMFDRAIVLAQEDEQSKANWDDLVSASKAALVETGSWPEPQLQEAK